MAGRSDSVANKLKLLARVGLGLVAVVMSGVVGFTLFVRVPDGLAELLGVLLTIGVVLAAVRVSLSVADSVLPGYNTAEVAVEGPISRDPSGVGPTSGGVPADDVVDQIERADETDAVDALVVKLNTPGGEIVPSDDIRRAVAGFDGPTVAYATDLCASGGMWIASGCDELWARDVSQIGSIGVLGLRPNLSEFLQRRGIRFERITAGEYKDAGQPVTEFSEEDLEYLQGLTDGFYDQFVDRVAEGMDLDPAFVRETEARVYLGSEAAELGLVDAIGDRKAVDERVTELLGEEPTTREFSPDRNLRERVSIGSRRVEYSLGASVADRFSPDKDVEFRL